LGPDPRLRKKNLPGRGLTKVEIHCPALLIENPAAAQPILSANVY